MLPTRPLVKLIGCLVAVVVPAAGCGVDPAGRPSDVELPDTLSDEEKLAFIEAGFAESAQANTFPPADCSDAELCTGPVAARPQCFAASSEASFRFEAYQSFNVPRAGEAGFVKVLLRRLFSVAPTSAAVIRVEIRELTGDISTIRTSPVIASGTKSLTALTSVNTEHRIDFDTVGALTPATGTAPKYALLFRVTGDRGSVGIGCTDELGAFDAGSAGGWKRLRISGTDFTDPPVPVTPRDLSFSLGYGCSASSDGAPDCASATDVGSIATGQTVTVGGTIAHDDAAQWYRVAFPPTTSFQQRGAGTPTVRFGGAGAGDYRLEFFRDSCASAPFQSGGPFTSFTFADTGHPNGEILAGPPNPCVGAQCTATVVATACSYTSGEACAAPYGTGTYCGVSSNATCGCSYATIKTAHATDAGLQTGFTTAAQQSCGFANNGNSGPGSYSSRAQAWPEVLFVRVTNPVGAIPACMPYVLEFTR